MLGGLASQPPELVLRLGEVRILLDRFAEQRLRALHLTLGLVNLAEEDGPAMQPRIHPQRLLDVREGFLRLSAPSEHGHAEEGVKLRLGVVHHGEVRVETLRDRRVEVDLDVDLAGLLFVFVLVQRK